MKIGLSKKELSKVLDREVSLILLVPFVIAMIYLWIGIYISEQYAYVSNVPTAIACTAVLIFIQVIFWIGVKTAYRKSMFNKIFDEI